MKYTTATAALALLIFGASTAHADTSTASLTLNNIHISAFDLDLNDGQVGTYQFLSDGVVSRATINQSGRAGQTQTAPGFFPNLSLNSTVDPNITGSVAIDDDGLAIAVSATGDFKQITATGSSADWNLDDHTRPPALNVRLAPRTGLLASGDYQIDLSSSCSLGIACTASVMLDVSIEGGEFGQNTSFSRDFRTKSPESFTGTAGASYLNLSDAYQDVILVFKGSASILSVPEPGTVGLVMAGLLTAAAARRRSSRRA